MKRIKITLIGFAAVSAIMLPLLSSTRQSVANAKPKGCVFKTIFGEEETLDSAFFFKTPEKVESSLDKALAFIMKAQQNNGGWGAGLSSKQNILDPHAVKTDPATTAMVLMSLLRTGNTLQKGAYSTQVSTGLEYLLKSVESSDPNSSTITKETGTQIQAKLGYNIDVVLTAQLLSNMVEYVEHDPALKKRVTDNPQVCVNKIQKTQSGNGSFSGGSWAGVLQSSFASSALESAYEQGIKVDTVVLKKSQQYQTSNYDVKTGMVDASDGASIVLYSVSSTVRNTSVNAKKVKKDLEKAEKEGKISSKDTVVTAETLQKIGYTSTEAQQYSTSYNVYNSAKKTAQQDNVMKGFGNNGGEEYLSFLQTGESMIINKDSDWKKWYDNISGQILSYQNNDGSWNGHHCITSPVFCTATAMLILSVNNDVERLAKMGK